MVIDAVSIVSAAVVGLGFLWCVMEADESPRQITPLSLGVYAMFASAMSWLLWPRLDWISVFVALLAAATIHIAASKKHKPE